MSSAVTDMEERRGGMLAEVADMCLGLARKLHEQAMAAETPEETRAAAGAFHRISRSLRQTLALEARLERERARQAREDERCAAEARRERLRARKSHVGQVGSRLIWTEAERDEVGALLVDLSRWLDEESFFEDAFLEGPVEDLIARLRGDLGLAEAPDPPSGPRPDPPAGENDDLAFDDAPAPAARRRSSA